MGNSTTGASTVVLKARLEGAYSNVLLDSGAAVSIIDSKTLENLKLTVKISSSSETLTDASGNNMKIRGFVTLNVHILGLKKTALQRFQVVDSHSPVSILVGRDFLRKFGQVTFDFDNNSVKLGPAWIRGAEIETPIRVRVAEKTVIPGRSEAFIKVKCDVKTAFLEGDFDPATIGGMTGIYASRTRVIPNSAGIFTISVLNVSTDDMILSARKAVGTLHAAATGSITPGPSNDTPLYDCGTHLSAEEKTKLMSLISSYQDLFAQNPKKPQKNKIIEHKIITDDSMPIYQKPRRVPTAWEPEINSQITDMLENDIIRPSESPWNSPIILVKKKDNTTRFVCDFRKLNDVTKKDTYPLPHIRDVIDKMAGAVYWTTLDAASAYWSMPLKEEDKEKTAFSVPRGKFEFNVTPYGLCNAGASYQRLMDICLSGLPAERTLAYMDDIAIFSRTFDEHLKDIEAVFGRLRSTGITLKQSKCAFAKESVEFLGYELSMAGIKPQTRLTDAIRDFERPTTKKDLKRFLGLAGFYRNFIKDFAEISKPLNNLTSDQVVYQWDPSCERAFTSLKNELCSEPTLAFPRCGEQFIVEVDASDVAVGGVLSQVQSDNSIHPVAYFSNTLSKCQQKWSTHSKEAFALLMAVRNWHVYLAGTDFVLNSDHNPLVHLRNLRDPRGKFARWISELEEYNYTVQYIPGKLNVKADALSRTTGATTSTDIFDMIFEDKVYAINYTSKDFKEQLEEERSSDPVLGPAKRLIADGNTIREGRLKRVSGQLRIEDNVLTKSGRPILPASMRRFVTLAIHEMAHFGTDKTYALLRDRFYWPNIYKFVH